MDALLAQFALEEKAKNSADVREDVPAPSARVYASFTAHSTSVSPCSFKGALLVFMFHTVVWHTPIVSWDHVVCCQNSMVCCRCVVFCASCVCHCQHSSFMNLKCCIACQGDIYLFGGEFFDGAADKLYTFADLYKYQTTRDKWTRILIPKGYIQIWLHRLCILNIKHISCTVSHSL